MHYEQIIDILNQYKIIPWTSQALQKVKLRFKVY